MLLFSHFQHVHTSGVLHCLTGEIAENRMLSDVDGCKFRGAWPIYDVTTCNKPQSITCSGASNSELQLVIVRVVGEFINVGVIAPGGIPRELLNRRGRLQIQFFVQALLKE